jgi:hypothetical protein
VMVVLLVLLALVPVLASGYGNLVKPTHSSTLFSWWT